MNRNLLYSLIEAKTIIFEWYNITRVGSLFNYRVIVAHKMRGLSSHASKYTILHMEWFHRTPSIEYNIDIGSESCLWSVVKLRERRDLISNCVVALWVAWLNAGMGKIIELNRVANLKINFWILLWSNRLRLKEENLSIARLWVQIWITEHNSKIVEFANFNFSINFSIKFTSKGSKFVLH